MLRVVELKPPTCEEIKLLIPRLVHKELGPVQRGTVLAHFLHCPQCAEEYHLQLEQAVVANEVQLPHLKRDFLERALRRMERLEAGISILWEEIKEQETREAQEKKKAIIETLMRLSLFWLRLQHQTVRVRKRGAKAIRTRGGPRVGKSEVNIISAELLKADLQSSEDSVPFEIISAPQFTSDERFRCELVTDNLRFEGYTVSLTICSEDKPVVTFSAELLKTEDEPEKLKAFFSEEGFDDISPSLVPIENIRLQVLPM